MEINDLIVGTLTDIYEDNEQFLEDKEIELVLFYNEIYWIFITSNPNGIFRFDDGYNKHYSNSLQDSVNILNKFIIDNNG